MGRKAYGIALKGYIARADTGTTMLSTPVASRSLLISLLAMAVMAFAGAAGAGPLGLAAGPRLPEPRPGAVGGRGASPSLPELDLVRAEKLPLEAAATLSRAPSVGKLRPHELSSPGGSGRTGLNGRSSGPTRSRGSSRGDRYEGKDRREDDRAEGRGSRKGKRKGKARSRNDHREQGDDHGRRFDEGHSDD